MKCYGLERCGEGGGLKRGGNKCWNIKVLNRGLVGIDLFL